MGETHRHCQCDYCSGEDCGRDNPDKLKAEQESAQKEHDNLIRKEMMDKMFPVNTKLNANGDLHGGWELDPKALFKLKKAIQANPQFTHEPEAEVIEVVVLAIKNDIRKGEL